MILFFALLLLVSVIALFIGRALTRTGQSDAHRIELFLSGEPITDQYRPLQKLLQKADWQFLSSQPGVTPATVRQFRAQRRKLFRHYLSNLVSDFGVLCFLIRSLMVQSAVDRPDLSAALRKVRTTFYSTVVRIHVHLVADAVGIPEVSIDATELVRALESLSAQARMLQLATEPSLA
jgi:hypothetical protein